MVMLDTDFIVAVLRGEPAAVRLYNRYLAAGDAPCMSTITVFELLRGVQRSRDPDADREAYAKATASIYVVDFTYIEADVAAHIDTNLARAGTPIGVADTMIAATCVATGMPLVTRNKRHFSKVRGLKLQSW